MTEATMPEPPADDAIFGGRLPALRDALAQLLASIESIRHELRETRGEDPVEHCLGRIKTAGSLREKCLRKGVEPTAEAAFRHITDIVGVRVVCAFLDDVYLVRDRIAALPGMVIEEETDYIRHVKPNGYRSYHMVVSLDGGPRAEVQLRTISMDTWAALEHQIKYKRDLKGDLELITSELKRCADELASTDLSMQTIRNMISAGEEAQQ
ncbi:GTP pyrophosphokinase [Olsenella urininfantis]|uniref:GTP pyrophosphokinase n=1 Tax=Olsenella urininfantis TaxID=1871033 RepID=UPI00190EE992|nr:GTP pyrophosphokinase family protein [Olsenella urininfantis]